MTAFAKLEVFRQAAFDSAPRRLSRIVDYGAALGLAGTGAETAYGLIARAIDADGTRPIQKLGQRRALSMAWDCAQDAYLGAQERQERDELRAYRQAPELLRTSAQGATIGDLAESIGRAFPLISEAVATRIANGTVIRLSRPPIAQRGPHPTEIFECVTIEPSAEELALHRRALELKETMGMLGRMHVVDTTTMPADQTEVPKVPVAFDIAHEPGLLGDLARWSLSYAFRPIPEFAQLSALATLAPVFGRRYASPTGLGLNLYLVGLATTGSGKEALIGAPPAALEAAGLGFLIGAGDFTSDSAIEVALRARPNFLAPIDEVGEFVGAAQHRNAASHSRTIRKALLELHGKSRPDGRWSGKQKADAEHDKASDPVYSPHLSILGASTGQGFFEALTEANLADGFINRLIVVEGGKPGARNLDPARLALPPLLADELKAAFEAAGAGNLAGATSRLASTRPTMQTVPWADEAAMLAWLRITDWEDDARDAGREGITGRAAANTQVVATIRALSRDAKMPAVSAEDIAWAWSFVLASIETVERGARENMAGSEFESLVKAIEAAVTKAGANGLPRSVLLRQRGVGKHLPQMVDAALKRLEETDVIFKDMRPGTGGRPGLRIIAKAFHEA